MALYEYVFVEVVTCVPFRDMSTWEKTVQQQIHGTDGIVGTKIGTVLLGYFGLHVQHRVGQIDVIFVRPANVEFDWRTVTDCSQRMTFYPGAVLDAGLCRRHGKQIQLGHEPLARVFVNERHTQLLNMSL